MSTWAEELTDVLVDLLAHARGCKHDDHTEEDRKVCGKVAEKIIQMTDARIDRGYLRSDLRDKQDQ